MLAALPDDPPEVVFLADAATMRGEHPLVAVITDPEVEDDHSDIPGLEVTRQFRILPAAVSEMVGNLAIANMDFEDFSRSAYGDPQKIHRGVGLTAAPLPRRGPGQIRGFSPADLRV